MRYAPVNVPYCFYPVSYPGYSFLNVTQTAFGAVAYLGRKYASGYPGDVELLKMTVKYESESRLRVKVSHYCKLHHTVDSVYRHLIKQISLKSRKTQIPPSSILC